MARTRGQRRVEAGQDADDLQPAVFHAHAGHFLAMFDWWNFVEDHVDLIDACLSLSHSLNYSGYSAVAGSWLIGSRQPSLGTWHLTHKSPFPSPKPR